MTSLWHASVGLFTQLCRALVEHGEVTIRIADLGHHEGLTDFRDNIIYVSHTLTRAGVRAAICHELGHLRRGPAGRRRAAEEERQVRDETARMLAPEITPLRKIRRTWTAAERAALARVSCGDHGVVHDTLDTGEIPLQRGAVEGAVA